MLRSTELIISMKHLWFGRDLTWPPGDISLSILPLIASYPLMGSRGQWACPATFTSIFTMMERNTVILVKVVMIKVKVMVMLVKVLVMLVKIVMILVKVLVMVVEFVMMLVEFVIVLVRVRIMQVKVVVMLVKNCVDEGKGVYFTLTECLFF